MRSWFKLLILSVLLSSLLIVIGCGDSTSSDKTPPTVSIAQPLDGAEVVIGNAITITINADDNKSVKKVEVIINDAVITTLTSSPYIYSWSTSGKTPGNYEIVAKAYDKSNNSAESTPRNIELLSPNQAPAVPFNPFPANNAVGVGTTPTLTWECSDPDDDTILYDVFFSTSQTMPNEPTVDNQTGTSYTPNQLQLNTMYYWRIDAYDGTVKTVGNIWRFTTNSGENLPPLIPSEPFPADNSIGASPTARLTWVCSDPEATYLSYDVYFGTESDPPIVSELLYGNIYNPGALEFGVDYYWKIVASDGVNTTTSPIWSFKTNRRPPVPSNPFPIDYSVGIPNNITLTWDCPDADSDTLKYKVYFGTSSNPILVSNNQLPNSFIASNLQSATTYYWKIEASDDYASATSPIWRFSTNYSPETPYNPFPANGQSYVPLDVEMSWVCSDPDGDEITYEIYLGVQSTPPLVAEGLTEAVFSPTNLEYAQTYNWRIKAWDGSIWKTGPLWSFNTLDGPNEPPHAPSNPHPLNNETNLPTNLQISWHSDDPNTGQPLTYDIYLGTDSNPSLYASSVTDTLYAITNLSTSTQYFWKIAASDGEFETESPVWSFTTGITAGAWSLDIVGTCSVPYGIYGMDYHNGIVYGADRGSGLLIINVNNPHSPFINGSINTPNFCYDVFYDNGFAYTVDLEWGMQISNVSNPIVPQYVGYGNTPGNAEGIWVESGYAYIADSDMGLQIFDLQNQSSPQLVGNYDTNGSAHQVCVVDGYAYIADQENGLVVVDVSDPANPQYVTTSTVTPQAVDVFASGNYLYVCTGEELEIFNISSPTSPIPVSSCAVDGFAYSCYVEDSFAIVAAGDGGVAIIDVSDPNSPVVMQQTTGDTDELISVKDVRMHDNFIFISNGDAGFSVMQIFE
ncbi:MAG: hypothetical protein JXR56_03410 [Candidatus Cloacimonetes bacterium]|nr:hypothetical protein [Candidatus Cloacimonadota bacterium]